MVEYFYKKGSKYISGSSKNYEEFRKLGKRSGFLCLLLQEPSEEDCTELCSDLNIPERPVKKFKGESRSLRYSFDPLAFTLLDYYAEGGKIKITRLLFVVKSDMLVLITAEHSQYYKELFQKVVSNAQSHKKFSIGYIMYQFLHEDAKDNYEVLEIMDNRIEALEEKVLSDVHEKSVTHEIVSQKKDLIKMSKRLWASSKVIFAIKRDITSIKLTKEDQALLEDIYDTFIHQIDMIDTMKETVTDYLEIFTTTISNRLAMTSNELNMVMKKMAALTIIIMVPTLIAGIYGTNFVNLPEVKWRYGYAYMIAFMLISTWFTYSIFHKKKWV